MRKTLTLLCFICFGFLLEAQIPARFQTVYGGASSEYGYAVKTVGTDGYILAGTTNANGITDGFIVRVDTAGVVKWAKIYGHDNVDVLQSIKMLPDSGFIAAGYTNSKGAGGYDGWLLRLNKLGDTLWTKTYGTSDWDFFYDVYVLHDSGFVICGGTYGLGNGDEDMYVIRTDSLGNVQWTKTWGGAQKDEARRIIETGDSLLVMIGESKSTADVNGDSWLLRMDAGGDTLWTRTGISAATEDIGYGLADAYPSPQIITCGFFRKPAGDKEAYIASFDYNGNYQYTFDFGGAADDEFQSVLIPPQGTFAALGSSASFAMQGNMYFFHNRVSNPWFTTTYGTLEEDAGYSLDLAADGGYVACGFTRGYNSIMPNMYLVKIDTAGYSTMVLASTNDVQQSERKLLVYPVPASDFITFEYSGNASIQQISIQDISGKTIYQDNSFNAAVAHQLNISAFSEGLYFYSIVLDNGKTISGKFIKTQQP
ncbi:MAG: hypothetical protein Fur0041_12740 [Bacteroidia bacterium]